MTTTDYIYVRQWGHELGSYPYYVNRQVGKAREAGAPQDALYEQWDNRGPTGHWITLDDLRGRWPDRRIDQFVKKAKERAGIE